MKVFIITGFMLSLSLSIILFCFIPFAEKANSIRDGIDNKASDSRDHKPFSLERYEHAHIYFPYEIHQSFRGDIL